MLHGIVSVKKIAADENPIYIDEACLYNQVQTLLRLNLVVWYLKRCLVEKIREESSFVSWLNLIQFEDLLCLF